MRGLIENKRLSLVEFAKQYGVGESQLHNWLKRADPPLPKHWERLAKFFGVSVNYLVRGIPENVEAPAKPEPPVHEDAGDYDLDGIENALRRKLETLIAGAKGNRGRLGWIEEQMNEHLRLPKNWMTNEELNQLVRAQLAQIDSPPAHEARARARPGQSDKQKSA